SKGQPASFDARARRLRRRDRAANERATHGDRPHDIAGQRAPGDEQGLRSTARNVARDSTQGPQGAGRPRRTHRSLDAGPGPTGGSHALTASSPAARPYKYKKTPFAPAKRRVVSASVHRSIPRRPVVAHGSR